MTRRPQRRRARGQAIVVGAFGLLIMFFSIIATLNIGQAVSERIRLQNAADATAYSLAAEEARLFNFFAFTNRAQVAHYVAAMTIQSYASYLTYAGGVFGGLRDLLWDAASIYQCICDLNINAPIPISPPYCIAARVMSIAGDAVAFWVMEADIALETIVDWQAADLVDAMYLLNRGIWRAQLQQGLLINLLLTSGGYPFVEDNDEAVDFGLVNGFNAVFNQLEFNQVFDRGAGINFSLLGVLSHPGDMFSPRIHDSDNDDDDVIAARQVMTEIANASRLGTGSSDLENTFITDRSEGNPPLSWGAAGFGWVAGWAAPHRGQTRMVSGDSGGGMGGMGGGGGGGDHEVELDLPIDAIRADSDGAPEYYTGSVIASDDYIHQDRVGNVGFTMYYAGQSRHLGAAIIADEDDGGHYGYEHTDTTSWSQGTMRLPPDVRMLISFNPLETACALACCSSPEETYPDDLGDDYDDHDYDHTWEGVVAYPKFNPDPDETRDYHQPSTWIFLNLPPENFNRARSGDGDRPWSVDFSYTFGARTVTLDTTPGHGDSAFLPFLRGLNVISRGQAYYHRPRPRGEMTGSSNWREHPNFFNPFWRARLAPVGQKLVQLYNRLVSRELHANPGTNVILAGGLNLIRNMMGDVFFHTVTAVMTH